MMNHAISPPAGAAAASAFLLSDWMNCSLFLDFDGTLVDLADTPDAVRVAPGLVQVLRQLHDKLEGRLAIVSGRPIAQIDAMLSPLKLAVAGVHGAERRDAQGHLHYAEALPLAAARVLLQRVVDAHPALLLEEKRGALALHYRQAPELRAVCEDAMLAAQADSPGMVLLHGKMVLELKPAASTKGSALADFLQEAPFLGHRPLFAGDDTTDEAGFAYAQQAGGVGVKIGPGPSIALRRLDSPQALRAQLAQAAIAMSQGDTI
ncbi:trehalose-phosphatase [Oxalobacteraceae bacterium A2-2]